MKSVVLLFALLSACRPPQLAHSEGASKEFAGVFTENFQESIFFPCGNWEDESGWWVRFTDGLQADRIRYQYKRAGFPNATHCVRVRGRLSPPGRYGTGFHRRELLVEQLLEVDDPRGCSVTYNSVPTRWLGAGSGMRRLTGASISADGALAATADKSGYITIWRSRTGEKLRRFRYEPPSDACCYSGLVLVFSPLNDLLALAGSTGIVRVWNVSDGSLKWNLRHSSAIDTLRRRGRPVLIRGGNSPPTSIAFTPKGDVLVTTGGYRAYAWSMTSGSVIDTLSGAIMSLDRVPASAVVANDPGRIITRSPDGTLGAYSLTDAKEPLLTAASPAFPNGVMKVSPDSRWLGLATGSDSIFLWSLHGGKVSRVFTIPSFFGGGIAFSPDGNQIAVAGGQFNIYVWDTNTGTPVERIHRLNGWAMDMWYRPNGDSIVYASRGDSVLYVVPVINAVGRLQHKRPVNEAADDWIASGGAHVVGLIQDSSKGVPSVHVQVFKDSLHRIAASAAALTDSEGYFAINSFRPGSAFLLARRIGYKPRKEKILLHRGNNTVLVKMLRTIEVESY